MKNTRKPCLFISIYSNLLKIHDPKAFTFNKSLLFLRLISFFSNYIKLLHNEKNGFYLCLDSYGHRYK